MSANPGDVPPIPDDPADQEPDLVATPEGDNEYAPDERLKPLPEGETGLQEPRDNAPDPYKGE